MMPLLRSVMAITRRLLLPALAGFWGRLVLGGVVEIHLASRRAGSSRRRGRLGMFFRFGRRRPHRRKTAPWLLLVLLLFRRLPLPRLLCRWRFLPSPGSRWRDGSAAASCLGRRRRRLGRRGLGCRCVWVRNLLAAFPGTFLLRLRPLPPLLIVTLAGSLEVFAALDETGAAVIALDGDLPN